MIELPWGAVAYIAIGGFAAGAVGGALLMSFFVGAPVTYRKGYEEGHDIGHRDGFRRGRLYEMNEQSLK